jgi:hypothetical protein
MHARWDAAAGGSGGVAGGEEKAGMLVGVPPSLDT